MSRSQVRLQSCCSSHTSHRHRCPVTGSYNLRCSFAGLFTGRVVAEQGPLKCCLKRHLLLARRLGIKRGAAQTDAKQTARKAFPEQISSANLLQVEALVAASLALWLLSQQRPRGWCNHTCVQVAQSQIAGQGVFAIRHIPQGTIIGAYPGVPRTAERMLHKATLAPNCKRYVFQTTSNVWLDPTDSSGFLSGHSPLPGWNFDVSMAYVNEPPVGHGVNVQIIDGEDELDMKFQTSCNISAGDELFLDYGSLYDRSNYQKNSS